MSAPTLSACGRLAMASAQATHLLPRDRGRRRLHKAARSACEQLESRTMLSVTLYPYGGHGTCVYLYFTPYCDGTVGEGWIYLDPSVYGWHDAPFTIAPLRYFDGMVVNQTQDLLSNGFGKPWGQTRSWSPAMQGAGVMGNHWMAEQLLQLVDEGSSAPDENRPANATDTIIAVATGDDQRWFDKINNVWVERFGGEDTLTISGSQAVLTDTSGAQTVFYDPTTSNDYAGQFISQTDPYGNSTFVYSNDNADGNGYGNITEVRRKNGNTIESWQYAYITNPADSSKVLLQNVKLRRSTDGANFTTVRQVTYAYYGTSDIGGNQNDLKSATIQDGNGNTIDVYYYRYWLSGQTGSNNAVQPTGGLKYVLGPQSYARMAASLPNGTTPDTASDTQISAYADSFYTYTGPV